MRQRTRVPASGLSQDVEDRKIDDFFPVVSRRPASFASPAGLEKRIVLKHLSIECHRTIHPGESRSQFDGEYPIAERG